jgi:F420-0:gamma-glutamyl ligase
MMRNLKARQHASPVRYNSESQRTVNMPKKSLPPHEEDGSILVNAAKVIGAAAGKIAALASAPLEARPAAKSAKVGKLPKKQGHRLPRRQKKAQQKKPASHKG